MQSDCGCSESHGLAELAQVAQRVASTDLRLLPSKFGPSLRQVEPRPNLTWAENRGGGMRNKRVCQNLVFMMASHRVACIKIESKNHGAILGCITRLYARISSGWGDPELPEGKIGWIPGQKISALHHTQGLNIGVSVRSADIPARALERPLWVP